MTVLVVPRGAMAASRLVELLMILSGLWWVALREASAALLPVAVGTPRLVELREAVWVPGLAELREAVRVPGLA